MAQKLFSTGPGIFRMADINEKRQLDHLDRRSWDLFESKMDVRNAGYAACKE